MAITLLCGFEMQALGEAFSSTGTCSISTAVKRTGAASLCCNPTSAQGFVTFQIRPAGGTLTNFAKSFRFYIRIDTLVGLSVDLVTTGSLAAAGTILRLNSAGTLTIQDGTGAGGATSTSAFTADATWHRIDVDVSGTTRTVYVDGTQWAQSTGGGTSAAQNSVQLGIPSSTTCNIYFDDLAIDDGSIGAPSASSNNAILLCIPTAGNNAASWTDGAGGTGDIHGSVDNLPPVGVAAATAAAKIKNAATGSNLDYVATMQTYTVAGVPTGAIVNAIQAICNDGEEVSTGTKAGGIWCASNPAQSASTTSFDYGDDTATVVGTFPSGWATHCGVVAVSPSVTLGTAPTVTVRKVGSTNRVVDVDFMGLYVDYSPAGPPSIPTLQQYNQAVNRAANW